MIVGVPKEIKEDEYRVSLTPAGALECELVGSSTRRNSIIVKKK